MFLTIQTRIEIKFLLLIIAALDGGSGISVVLTIQKQSEALLTHAQEKFHLFSGSMSAGIVADKSPRAGVFVNGTRKNRALRSTGCLRQNHMVTRTNGKEQ